MNKKKLLGVAAFAVAAALGRGVYLDSPVADPGKNIRTDYLGCAKDGLLVTLEGETRGLVSREVMPPAPLTRGTDSIPLNTLAEQIFKDMVEKFSG